MKTRLTLTATAMAMAFTAAPQTTIAPLSVTSTLGSFGSTPNVNNLIGNITPATTAGTTFPFAPGSGFSSGIGYVSPLGQWQGSMTYTFVNTTSVSRMLLWNAYFTFELNHSLRDAQLVLYNAMNEVVGTENVSFPQAVSSVLTPQVVDLSSEVLDVKKVVVTVQSLWGGNEISLRRMAFAGNGITTGIDAPSGPPAVRAFPSPAVDRTIVPVRAAGAVHVFDAQGRQVAPPVEVASGRVVIDLHGLVPGRYHAHVATGQGVQVVPFMVGR
ncbi:MAG: T9SS type A sorting domain-containing protein [Flavobacteriales bacterium]|jgi:hypothetical protein|nr:T9SS type A sorting domain-containing protein [Flavobacteriales bacterium]